MDDVKTVVKQVFKVWRLYKTQQLMLKTAMRQEIPFRLRKSLSRDFMICSLLKKEMANFYDALKCCMVDGCIMRPDRNAVYNIDKHSTVNMALVKIENVHRQIVSEYHTLINLAEDANIDTRILRQHQGQMEKMAEELSAQVLISKAEAAGKVREIAARPVAS